MLRRAWLHPLARLAPLLARLPLATRAHAALSSTSTSTASASSTDAADAVADDTFELTINDTTRTYEAATNPHNVPQTPPSLDLVHSYGEVLEWMMQKETLGQDVFLLGDPGSLRRSLIHAYCHLAEREVEYMAISRDTTEADLKQRREIANNTISYIDQPPVRAAKTGRVLVLDGIEKAERNVMPILNNLLENREMNLESGHMLTDPEKYDSLVADHGQDAVDAWGLIRVSPEFRVMVLGLPVPPYNGHRIDPPFRSRFQGKVIRPPTAGDLLELASQRAPDVDPAVVRGLVSYALVAHASSIGGRAAAEARGSPPTGSQRPPLPLVFPLYPGVPRALDSLQTLASQAPGLLAPLLPHILDATFPWKMALASASPSVVAEAESAMEVALAKLTDALGSDSTAPTSVALQLAERSIASPSCLALHFTESVSGTQFTVNTPASSLPDTLADYAAPPHVDPHLHASLVLDLAAGHDVALVGPRGVGKSFVARSVANALDTLPEILPIYKDMSTRDLLMRRTTSSDGDTTWEPTPLVRAALSGSLCILDGIDRLESGSLAVLQSLLHDRSITLANGLTLVRGTDPAAPRPSDAAVMEALQSADASDAAPLVVHPEFRVLGLGLPPSPDAAWLTSETASLFRFHTLAPLDLDSVVSLHTDMFPSLAPETVARITHPDLGLSLRQMLHVARRAAAYPSDERDAVERTLLLPFMPSVEREVFQDRLDALYGHSTTETGPDAALPVRISLTPTSATIGDVTVPRKTDGDPTLVPRIGHRFADIPAHTSVLASLLKDYLAGDSLLLIGPQGVGKNMLCDRFLEILHVPRQYIQLHRDSSVMALTSNPSFEGGVLTWGDSPLVKAAIHGHVLVVDEADKAPLEVVAVLKALIEDNHMVLPDGRKLVRSGTHGLGTDPSLVAIHPEFRVIVLANKPGFPFLGNDFYRECGDLFAVHSIDNPDPESELMMLKSHAGSMDRELLVSLTAAFRDLRRAVDAGLLSYPYSSRELVAIVRHAAAFPDGGLAGALHNVFDFDAHDPNVVELLASTFRAHGLPLGITPGFKTEFAPPVPLGEPSVVGAWDVDTGATVTLEVSESSADRDAEFEWEPSRKTPVAGDGGRTSLDANVLNELVAIVNVPSRGPPCALAPDAGRTGGVHIVGSSPETLFSYDADRRAYTSLDLFSSPAASMYGSAPPSLVQVASIPKTDSLFLTYEDEGLVLDPSSCSGYRFELPAFSSDGSTMGSGSFRIFGQPSSGGSSASGAHVLDATLADETGELVMYAPRGDVVHIFQPASGSIESISLPPGTQLESVSVISPLSFVVKSSSAGPGFDSGSSTGVLWANPETPGRAHLTPVGVDGVASLDPVGLGLPNDAESNVFAGPSLLAATDSGSLARPLVSSLPSSAGDLVGWEWGAVEGAVDGLDGSRVVASLAAHAEPDGSSSGNVVHAVERQDGAFSLAVVDLDGHTLRNIVFDPEAGTILGPGGAGSGGGAGSATAGRTAQLVDMVELPHGCVGTLFSNGRFHVFKVNATDLEAELGRWQAFVGQGARARGMTRLEKKRTKHKEASGPKHGKIDPDNTPHVGGNQWHGGTGGADTAGLGGVGGPYRVDAGHNVHQVPDSVKENLDEETAAAARAMGEAALAERLKEISMSNYEASLYERYRSSVDAQIRELQVVLNSLEAKAKERTWLSHQSTGDLDDAKIVEGLTGETNVYKRRGKADASASSSLSKPKRMLFVLDVSGSMYRFNGLDGRLERLLVSTLMLMEGLAPGVAAGTVQYSIVGHSGGSPRIPLVDYDSPPENEADRLRVLQTMAAHAQFCPAGDHTVEAAASAVDELAADSDADEKFVFVVSDANLDRYGIPPSALGDALSRGSDLDIQSYLIMVASFGEQAEDIKAALEPGKAFFCADAGDLVDVFRKIVQAQLK